jgi:hypothetical protein
MPAVKFKSRWHNTIAYCCVDNIHTYQSAWVRETIKNIADYTISNITDKGYDVFVSPYEDQMLKEVANAGYTHAVVYSPGTEFINGDDFFNKVKELINEHVFLIGHLLDRGDAYYELHHQCYVINLSDYKELGYPTIGQQQLGATHTQIVPLRSPENIHDTYTPIWVKPGVEDKSYNHKAHGWNILSLAFASKYTVAVFPKEIRTAKKHYYPESHKDFLKEFEWIQYKHNYCATKFVHTASNELVPDDSLELKGVITQVFTPASGTWWIDHLHPTAPVTVVLYDYNQLALDYWAENAIQKLNITYKFVLVDLLSQVVDVTMLDPTQVTLINLSNVFCYEGTVAFANLEHRLYKENQVLRHIKNHIPNAYINFCGRAATGFTPTPYFGQGIAEIALSQLTTPTWHQAGDWAHVSS